MYLIYEPFKDQLNAKNIISFDGTHIESLTRQLLTRCEELQQQMLSSSISLRANKLYIQCYDINYIYPPNYNFIEKCKDFIRSTGFIVFNHLDNFEIIRNFLSHNPTQLSRTQHPLTGDTLWHLNPFTIDMLQAEILNVYNFRGETPNERRMMAELLNLPSVTKFPQDTTNSWNNESIIFVNENCDMPREPLALCKYIRKNKER